MGIRYGGVEEVLQILLFYFCENENILSSYIQIISRVLLLTFYNMDSVGGRLRLRRRRSRHLTTWSL
jgi:hypothetical protein